MFQKRFVAAAVLALALIASRSSAVSQSSCFRNYYVCANSAANLDNFWRRSAAGLDCAVDLAACVRGALS